MTESFGSQPEERSIQELLDFGIIVIDKPSGPTSHQVAAYVQQILGIDKAGHSGTLDPKVTGVLPVGTGKATRLLEYLLKSGKEYVGIMHMHDDIEEYKVRQEAEKFIGKINQLPPKRSSVKRATRQRTIYDFRFLEVRGRDILFVADVQAGTYIRKLCHDFGLSLNTSAHMAELRRTRVAHFIEEQAVTLQTLSDAYAQALEGDEAAFRKIVLPAEVVVQPFPAVVIQDSAVHSLTHGATLKAPGVVSADDSIRVGEQVRIMTQKGELVCMATAQKNADEMTAERGIVASVDKVFMSSEVYPRMDGE